MSTTGKYIHTRRASEDKVHRRAKELHITPQRVFLYAYMLAAIDRAEAERQWNAYANAEKKDGVPELPRAVRDFCATRLVCARSSCKKALGEKSCVREHRNGEKFTVEFFCCPVCMVGKKEIEVTLRDAAHLPLPPPSSFISPAQAFSLSRARGTKRSRVITKIHA